jgi:hypothetical protein
MMMPVTFQWIRRYSVTETTLGATANLDHRASMVPPLIQRRKPYFAPPNTAGTGVLQWSRAAMGAVAFQRRGTAPPRYIPAPGSRPLQWGRRLSAAEIPGTTRLLRLR